MCWICFGGSHGLVVQIFDLMAFVVDRSNPHSVWLKGSIHPIFLLHSVKFGPFYTLFFIYLNPLLESLTVFLSGYLSHCPSKWIFGQIQTWQVGPILLNWTAATCCFWFNQSCFPLISHWRVWFINHHPTCSNFQTDRVFIWSSKWVKWVKK